MMHFLKQKERGYTLGETVVYIGLVTLLLLLVLEIAFSVAKNHERSRTYFDINSSAFTVMTRLSRDIRRATSVDTVESTLGASSGRLVLNMRQDDGSTDTTAIYLSGERVQVDENGSYLGDLSPAGIAVSNLTFRLFEVSTTTAIRIELTVAPDSPSTVSAVNFYGTYVLRGSYTE